jgi:hypothetical protein
VNFTQIVRVRVDPDDGPRLAEMAEEWDQIHAESDVMGYIGTRVLADLADPGAFLIVADFAEVEEGVSAREEAERNNEREVTQEWARRLSALAQGEPQYEHYDELYRTGLSRKGW